MKTVTFGVLIQANGGLAAFQVPIDASGQTHLEGMFDSTLEAVSGATIEDFQLAEKYSEQQCAKLGLTDTLASDIKALYELANFEVKPEALNNLDEVVAYFAAIDETGKARRLGLRQARTFKNLRSKPVWTLADGQLTVDNRPKFTLSATWELLTEGKDILIVSATAFERICDLSPAIREAAKTGLTEIAPSLPFLDMAPLEARVDKFTRSARIVADLRRRNDLVGITEQTLASQSDHQNIEYEVVDHKYIVKTGSEEKLLMLLDRRRYTDPLVTVNPDIYEADSRRKVGKGK